MAEILRHPAVDIPQAISSANDRPTSPDDGTHSELNLLDIAKGTHSHGWLTNLTDQTRRESTTGVITPQLATEMAKELNPADWKALAGIFPKGTDPDSFYIAYDGSGSNGTENITIHNDLRKAQALANESTWNTTVHNLFHGKDAISTAESAALLGTLSGIVGYLYPRSELRVHQAVLDEVRSMRFDRTLLGEAPNKEIDAQLDKEILETNQALDNVGYRSTAIGTTIGVAIPYAVQGSIDYIHNRDLEQQATNEIRSGADLPITVDPSTHTIQIRKGGGS